MCFHSKQTKSAQELKNRFKVEFPKENDYLPKESINGFEHPFTPVITSEKPNEIHLYQWGLIPSWAKNTTIQKDTLLAKIETIKEVASYKAITHQRCLILADGFYEWKHHDSKGKDTEKFLITIENDKPFAFAGLWSKWRNPMNGIEYSTYSMLTIRVKKVEYLITSEKFRELGWIKKIKFHAPFRTENDNNEYPDF